MEHMNPLVRVALVCIVFFGPMIFAPGANQGPMPGIFITGPAGALLGAVTGLFYGLGRQRGR
jgi:hypothetical protein